MRVALTKHRDVFVKLVEYEPGQVLDLNEGGEEEEKDVEDEQNNEEVKDDKKDADVQ